MNPIDLRSDTVTRPSREMRHAMAEADVGDDERDGDPTTQRLEQRVAELLGKERALFFPSGVMANQASVNLHTRPGTEVILDHEAHIIHWEMAGAAALSGAQVRPVRPSGLVATAADMRACVRARARHMISPSLVCVENTHNGAGGKVLPLPEMRAIREFASELALPVHLDGARLWNASVASGVPLADFAATADTVMVAFSKGLGAPIGAAVAGSAPAIEALWGIRKRFGGAMRQSGIVAAGALYALDRNLERLADDHANAREFARIVDGAGGAAVVSPDTNIVMIDLPAGHSAAPVIRACAEHGVLVAAWSASRIRAVTHLDVTAAQADQAAHVVATALQSAARRA
ncbi:MAG TPA: GntG family PLP-dependent aldolase [Gemmatimonadaceae bacterium]|nr:GntG family PLP-dependent aldolase [Gemmatimonadaceae bacterium]